jgi:hypothetical protein
MATTTPNFGWSVPTSTDLVKDGATAIETLGDSIDASLVDLKGGTTGQVLAKNSNTDMDFVWSNDAAGMTNPMTTTGDTIYSSSGSTPARLGIGTAGQFLAVNSGATAPEWVAAPSTSKNWSLLNTGGTALTGATTITVSGISGKDLIHVQIVDASASASTQIQLRLNADSGANYSRASVRMTGLASYAAGYLDNNSTNTGTNILLSTNSSDANSRSSGYVVLSGCNSAGLKQYIAAVGGNAANNDTQQALISGGFYSSTSTISSISLISTVGNFDAGTLYVYTTA